MPPGGRVSDIYLPLYSVHYCDGEDNMGSVVSVFACLICFGAWSFDVQMNC